MNRAVVLDHKVSIWIFVPKAGSSSIRHILCDTLGIPLTLDPAASKGGLSSKTPLPWIKKGAILRDYPAYWRWAIVRNPHARLVSAFCDPTIRNRFRFAAAGITATTTWPEFVRAVCDWPEDRMDMTVAPQTRLLSHNGEYLMDGTSSLLTDKGKHLRHFVGQIERPEDWGFVAERSGFPPLPHVHVVQHPPWREMYTADQYAMVADKYAEDIERFGY